MPLLTSPPLILNSSEEPANGSVFARVTTQFTNTAGNIVTRAQSRGVIVEGVLLAEDGSTGFVIPTTPDGFAVELYLSMDEYRDGRMQQVGLRRVVSVPATSTVTWLTLVDVIPAATDGTYVVPTFVQDLINAAQSSATAAAGSATAANSSALASASSASGAATSASNAATSLANVTPAVNTAITNADIPGKVATQIATQSGKVVSGTGSPLGVVTATVGTLYTDTAATIGASIWYKLTGTGNTGWAVTSGDTGWRNVSTLLTQGWTGTLYLRRVNKVIYLRHSSLNGTASTGTYLLSPITGFRGINNKSIGVLSWDANGNVRGIQTMNEAYSAIMSEFGSTCDDPWPTSMPGVSV
jgi:hypothetical protein